MEINLYGIGGIELDKAKNFHMKIIPLILLTLLGVFMSKDAFYETKVELCKGNCSLKQMEHEKCYEFNPALTDFYKLSLEFTTLDSGLSSWGERPNIDYSISVSGHHSESCSDSQILASETSYKAFLTNCENGGT